MAIDMQKVSIIRGTTNIQGGPKIVSH